MDTTAKFYLERMRTQVESARRRQYPDAATVPAIWLDYIERRLKLAEIQLSGLDALSIERRNFVASAVQTEIVSCYEDLEILRNTDSSQVAHFLVRALKPWFQRADPNCDYLFTSGITFEIETLYDKKTEKPPNSNDDAELTAGVLLRNIIRVIMPGGALGSAFHVPLVAHETGHVLHDCDEKAVAKRLEQALESTLEAIENFPDSTQGTSSRDVFLSWVEEVFADTICGFIMGPDGFFALHEKLRGDTAPNRTYPHNDIRVTSLRTYIAEHFGEVFTARKISSNAWSESVSVKIVVARHS